MKGYRAMKDKTLESITKKSRCSSRSRLKRSPRRLEKENRDKKEKTL